MSWRRALAAFFLMVLALSAQVTSDLERQERQAKEDMAARRYADAAVIYKAMLAAMPSEPTVRFNLALAMHFSGHYREAVTQLEMIRAAASQNPNYWFLLGVSYLKLAEPEKAIDPLEHAVRLNSKNRDAQIELGDAFLESGRLTSAEASFVDLTREYPNLPKTWEGLCVTEMALSRFRWNRVIRCNRTSVTFRSACGLGKSRRSTSIRQRVRKS